MDIDGWLRGIGLPQYAEMFRANDIDGELLGRLTNDDLKDIGVASFGHRKKLLEAIAELGGAATATPASPPVVPAPIPAAVAPPPISASAEAAGERRYLTVMFCDLVGSTGISAQLDAEEWRDLVGAYLDAASAAVDRDGRPCGEEARRRADVAVRLSGRARERRRARGARGACDPARAGRAEPQERRHRQAGACRSHRARNRSGGGGCGGRDLRRRRQHRGAGAGAGRAGHGAGHGAGAAPGRRTVRRRGARHAHAQGRAGADGAVQARPRERRRPPLRRSAISRRWSAATTKWRCCCGAGNGRGRATASWS